MAAANQPQRPGKRRRKRGKRAQARQGVPPAAPPPAPHAAPPTAPRAATSAAPQRSKTSKPTVVAAPAGGTKAKRVTPLDPRLTKVISTLNQVPSRNSVTLFRLSWVASRSSAAFMSELRIAFWNADGLSTQKARLFKTLLSQRRVDIGLISETHLRPVDKLKISGYFVYREDHTSPIGTAYRGLAVLVHRNVIHQLLPVPQLQTSYDLGVEICIERQPTRVFAFYKPPQNRIAMADVHTLLDSPLPTILAGDFNAKHTAWNSNIVSPDGRRLLDDADRHGYEVLGPEVPKHYPYCAAHMPDVIDIAVTHGLAAAPSLDVLDNHLITDHQAVLLALKTTPMTTSLPSPKHREDWRIFAEHMAEHSPSFRAESSNQVRREVAVLPDAAVD
ncbi:unnamed protein product [Leptidea sinapis]|uniref:Endonuclease/exonuclease/phosphatase domain-containing protein n=1 Tax=Leptidea sinapis TaxID=189913 RepID=A0A5E4QPY5_9NEOP|nr:unnamed protein product [Leptidea sinapis]